MAGWLHSMQPASHMLVCSACELEQKPFERKKEVGTALHS
jgi:hypothetical protein